MLPKWLTTERTDPAPAGSWRTLIKGRAAVALCGVAVWAAVVEARLIQVSVFQHTELAEKAIRQQQQRVQADGAARRHRRSTGADAGVLGGGRRHRRGSEPRSNVPLKRPRRSAARSRTARPADLSELVAKLSAKTKAFASVRNARSLTMEQVSRVAALKLRGVMIIGDTRRFYPNHDLAAHVLGFVGDGEVGRGGLERVYEKDVAGARRPDARPAGREAGMGAAHG